MTSYSSKSILLTVSLLMVTYPDVAPVPARYSLGDIRKLNVILLELDQSMLMSVVREPHVCAHLPKLLTQPRHNTFVLLLQNPSCQPQNQMIKCILLPTIFSISKSTSPILAFSSLTLDSAFSAAACRCCIFDSSMDSSERALLSSLASFSS